MMTVENREAKKAVMDATLKVKLKNLKDRYGKVPEAGATIEEMQMRYDTLSASLDEILEDYTAQVGKRPDIMKATHKVAKDQDFSPKKPNDLDIYANIGDAVLRKAPITTQEGIGNLLLFNGEMLERLHRQKEIKSRSAAEWRAMEREHITSSSYTLTDLYSDYKDIIEEGEADWKDYREERKKWKCCKHRFCLNVFPTDKNNFKEMRSRRSHAIYCSQTCNEGEKYAKKCYEETAKLFDNPTYLPDYFYEEVTEDWKIKRTMSNEEATVILDIEAQVNRNVPLFKIPAEELEEFEEYGCVTRKLSDVTAEMLESEKWNECKNIRGISGKTGDVVPLIVEGVSEEVAKTPIILRSKAG